MANNLEIRYAEWSKNHKRESTILTWIVLFLISTLSAFIFSMGFKTFISPEKDALKAVAGSDFDPESVKSFVSGGISGLSQNVGIIGRIILRSFKIDSESFEQVFYSGFYFVGNIPIIILAIKGIGKRFGIFTLINILEVSLFTFLMGKWNFLASIHIFVSQNGGMLARALFAGACTGLASALTFKFDFSDGGMNVIAYYLALKKSTSVGKYMILINAVIVSLFTVLSGVEFNWASEAVVPIFGSAIFSLLYMLMSTIVVDLINVRNKKAELKIVTTDDKLSSVLMHSVHHGATVSKGVGAFSGQEKTIITMVISSFEVNSVVKIVQKEDPSAFIQVTPLSQVYGRFFIRPLK